MKTLKEIWENLDLTDVRIFVHKNAHIKSDAYNKAAAKSKSNGYRVVLSAEIRE